MDCRRQRDKTRAGYFGSVKNRLGTKLPPGVTQPPGFVTGPWEPTSHTNGARNVLTTAEGSAGRHHIRNPKLRQYYLKEAAFPSETTKTLESPSESNSRNEQGVHQEDTVFSVASHVSGRSAVSSVPTIPSSALSATQQLLLPQNKASSARRSSPAAPTMTTHDLCLGPQPGVDAVTPPTPVSPSTDAEYDKLLDVEAVPMPDGQLCLLALPPECTEGEGPADMPYLKLFCRFITDRKGVVSGILLVTPNKIFFDPHKSLPLVQENGCEEYLFSCTVDDLASVSIISDISHVHFNKSTQRWKDRKKASKGRTSKDLVRDSQSDAHSAAPMMMRRSMTWDMQTALGTGPAARQGEEEGGESRDMAEVEQQLEQFSLESTGAAVLSSAATFCCGATNAELEQDGKTEQQPCLKKQISGRGAASSLMFVRMRQKQQAVKKRGFAAVDLGKTRTMTSRDAWFTLQQESSDELYAYLSQHRPDLCILEGGEEEEAERDEDDFVLLDDGEGGGEVEEEGEEEEEESPRHGRNGDEWEMVSVEDSRGRVSSLSADKEPDGLSDILRQSLILDAQQIRELCSELPPRTVGHSWKLAYGTSKHGASLKTLYRKLSASDSPVLLIIRDDNQQVFGAFLSHPLRPSDTFYGTGETFLFLLHPRFKLDQKVKTSRKSQPADFHLSSSLVLCEDIVAQILGLPAHPILPITAQHCTPRLCFHWTGENSFFIKGDLDSFAIGGGSGHFGLWLDETLYLGRSSPCYTFNNCSLSETSDFRVLELEAWNFW